MPASQDPGWTDPGVKPLGWHGKTDASVQYAPLKGLELLAAQVDQDPFKGKASKPTDSTVPDFLSIPGTLCRTAGEARDAVKSAAAIANLLEGSGTTIAWAYHLQQALVRLFT